MFKPAIFILLASAFLNTLQAQTVDKARLDQFFDLLNEKNKAMGSLLIVRNGDVVYSRIIGNSLINGAETKPLNASTRFRIGSITKTFTATMIFQLVEEKKLSLDDKLAKFFPQIPNAEKITIRHLLAHKSGLHDLADGLGKDRPRTQSEILNTIIKGGSDFEPGSKYAYSNSGFVVLGFIVEKLSGKPYEKVLVERITSKLKLNDTYLGTGLTDTSKNESLSYRHINGWIQEKGAHLSGISGAGGILSTSTDLVQFIRALFDGKLVSKNSLNRMMQDSLGLEPFSYNGKTFYGHAGGIDNFGSWLVYQPEEKLALAYTTNAKMYPVVDIINGVFEIYANKPFTLPNFGSVEVSPEILDKYVGVYSTEGAEVKFTVTRKDKTLYVQVADRDPTPLEPLAEDKFKFPNGPVNVEFNTANKTMIMIRNGGRRVFTKEN